MAIDVATEIIIDRPRQQVFEFVANPENDLQWIRALNRAQMVTAPPVGVGTRVERSAKMMGRTINYTTEIAGYEPSRLVDMDTVAGPFPMHVTYEFEDEGTGTLVRVRNGGGKGFLFKVAGPLIGRMVNSRVHGDLVALKSAAEKAIPPA
jgi:uncharacterized protein YndB with AHSA1/START domain